MKMPIEIIKHEFQIIAGRFNVAKHTFWETDDYDDAQWLESVSDDIESLEKLMMKSVHCKGRHFYNENGYISIIQMETDDEVWQYELNVEKFSE